MIWIRELQGWYGEKVPLIPDGFVQRSFLEKAQRQFFG
jgi:hypothetical protein